MVAPCDVDLAELGYEKGSAPVAERVSDKSKVALKGVVEDLAEEISQKAIQLANHAGRKTVKARDIKLAAKS